jgi:hypothetical protein
MPINQLRRMTRALTLMALNARLRAEPPASREHLALARKVRARAVEMRKQLRELKLGRLTGLDLHAMRREGQGYTQALAEMAERDRRGRGLFNS